MQTCIQFEHCIIFIYQINFCLPRSYRNGTECLQTIFARYGLVIISLTADLTPQTIRTSSFVQWFSMWRFSNWAGSSLWNALSTPAGVSAQSSFIGDSQTFIKIWSIVFFLPVLNEGSWESCSVVLDLFIVGTTSNWDSLDKIFFD